jgi:crotonobetainyl-CoA:carnitine CoA-transferase CaiB-like acyl-CoA transferase
VPETAETRATVLKQANIVLHSSDREEAEIAVPARRADQIFCNIVVTAEGEQGGWSEPLLQAATGIADITGTKDTAPTICEAPVVEFQTGIFAAAGILAAWPRRVATGQGQSISLSLLDCGLNGLTSFLPLVFAGKTPRRSGNRHPMAVPWNSYKAKDGWILLCSATDEQWLRLCQLMGREELSRGAFAKLADRIENCDEVDAIVEKWTRALTIKECVATLGGAGLAAGPILTLGDLKEDPNLIHRRTISDGPVPMPLSFVKTAFGASGAQGLHPEAKEVSALPLAGLRVLEIGQYTTAPLAAKQLAMLGAEVIKIEPPGGEASRAWPPHQDGQGYFFTMNNANKRSCLLDLRSEQDRTTFSRLLQHSDVLIENLKPGSLERLGFGAIELHKLNPRLVYCGISGFGMDSAYPGRPAFDTVIQAMSGLMDATRAGGLPYKLGISAADVTGGIAGLFAVMCGLEQRRRTGRGVVLDLSMQDVAVWATQSLWNRARRAAYCILPCSDGYVAADCSPAMAGTLVEGLALASRADVIGACEGKGVAACSVRTLSEIAADTSIVGSGAVKIFTGADGKSWPLFSSPYWFSAEQVVPLKPIGNLGEANSYVALVCSS